MDEILNDLFFNQNANGDTNQFYAPGYVEFLIERYMPYCFIWSSLVLKGFDPHVTRWTNGAIESFIGTRKRKEKSLMNLMPAQYANYTYPLAIGNVDDFDGIFKKVTEKKDIITKKPKKTIKKQKKTTEKFISVETTISVEPQTKASATAKNKIDVKVAKASTAITKLETTSKIKNSNANEAISTSDGELPQITGPTFEDEQPPSAAQDTWLKRFDPSNLVQTTIQGKTSIKSKTIGFYSAPAKDILNIKPTSTRKKSTIKQKRALKNNVLQEKQSNKGKSEFNTCHS
jgi:hypothetical protein